MDEPANARMKTHGLPPLLATPSVAHTLGGNSPVEERAPLVLQLQVDDPLALLLGQLLGSLLAGPLHGSLLLLGPHGLELLPDLLLGLRTKDPGLLLVVLRGNLCHHLHISLTGGSEGLAEGVRTIGSLLEEEVERQRWERLLEEGGPAVRPVGDNVVVVGE
eukprot:11576368-Alexandrium_andersonii.AAC.1